MPARTLGDTPRTRWQRGDCPCCGMPLDWWDGICNGEAVAEGVRICGRCVEQEHMRDGFLAEMLSLIVTGK